MFQTFFINKQKVFQIRSYKSEMDLILLKV